MKPADIHLKHGNPDTRHASPWIEYDLPQPAKIALEVYAMSGEKLITLLDEEKPAGAHSFDFATQKLTAGSYYCRFAAYDNAERLFYVSVNKLAF